MPRAPLLAAKLAAPRPGRVQVPRPRLLERLDRGAEGPLLLVSAPAGFGKTTLLAQWRASRPDAGRSVAWLSLDRGDSPPAVFWSYLLAALRTVVPGAGAGALALLEGGAPVGTVLTALLNELGTLEPDAGVVLVLDDHHLLDDPAVHEGVLLLVEHCPPGLHVVLAGRADPPLPLARLRARGQLVEVRADDLRFTPAETASYLADVMGLRLAEADVAALDGRAEGWVAALQLAGLSLQGRPDPAAFLAGFAGDTRFVVDYLVEEVLQRQSEPVQDFLLRTCVLSRLTGPLCDAVTGRTDGRAALEALERADLFVVPLDDSRQWYRYHHLFADMLRARLPGSGIDVPELHLRASRWCETAGERDLAVDHALAGGHLERAADLVELAVPASSRERREATLSRWFAALPEELFADRPVLAIGHVAALMSTGAVERVEERLGQVQPWLDAGAGRGARPAGMVVRDEAELARLPGMVAVYRAGLALLGGDPAGTATYARQALSGLAEGDHLVRGAAGALLGLASWSTGDLSTGQAAYGEAMRSLARAGHVSDVLGCAVALADMQVAEGRLSDAQRTVEEALRQAAAVGGPPLRGTPDMHVGLAALHVERGEPEAAAALLRRADELGEHLGLPQHHYRHRLVTARLRWGEGDLDGAAALLEDAQRVYRGDFSPDVRPLAALRVRLHLLQGRTADAERWVRERALGVDDELDYLRECEHLTLVRVLAQRGRRSPDAAGQASALLGRLLQAAEDGGRTAAVLEALVLQALLHAQRSRGDAAMAALERALALAAVEGHVRTVLDEGPAMTALLHEAVRRGVARDAVRRLLPAAGGVAAPRGTLVVPLSDREREVLRLLSGDLGGPGIARELVVSLNTVRTHTKSIYAKLGVNDRRAAVRRARELHLLP